MRPCVRVCVRACVCACVCVCVRECVYISFSLFLSFFPRFCLFGWLVRGWVGAGGAREVEGGDELRFFFRTAF